VTGRFDRGLTVFQNPIGRPHPECARRHWNCLQNGWLDGAPIGPYPRPIYIAATAEAMAKGDTRGAWRVDVAFDPFSKGTLEQCPTTAIDSSSGSMKPINLRIRRGTECIAPRAKSHREIGSRVVEMRALAFISSSPNLQTCHDCTAEYRRQEVLRAAIRRPEPRYRAPHDLRARVIASIQSQTDVLCRAPWWRGGITGWLGAGVSLALATSLLSVVTCLASRRFSGS
jgi:hypothetical protein